MSHSQLIPYVSALASFMPYLEMTLATKKGLTKKDELQSNASSMGDYLTGYHQENERDEFFTDAQYIFKSSGQLNTVTPSNLNANTQI